MPATAPALQPVPIAVDLFAGAGGATVGLKSTGFRVVVAVEHHAHAAATYRSNHPEVELMEQDIRNIDPVSALAATTATGSEIALLNSCPPCQGFSSLHRGRQDGTRNDLVLETARWTKALRPRVVILENVPRLRHDARYQHLLKALSAAGYRTHDWLVDAADIGTPQRRKRLIMIACRDAATPFPESVAETLPTEWPFQHDARAAIRGLGRVGTKSDPLHVARKSSPLVRERLEAIPIGGGRFDLPPRLQLKCHKNLKNRTATCSYERIPSSGPCGTLTTRCTTPSSGPFVHPSQPRGISLREAAMLQTFPRTYQFVGHYESIERQIGNAVPPRLTAAVAHMARSFL